MRQANTVAPGSTVMVGHNQYTVRAFDNTIRLALSERPNAWFEVDGLSPDDAVRFLSNIEYRYQYMRR